MGTRGLGSRWRRRIGVATTLVTISLAGGLGIYDGDDALLRILSPPGSGYDSTSGLLYTAKGAPVPVTRAGTQSCNGGTVAADKPCVEGGALVIPASGQTTTVATPAELSRTEGSACATVAPAWTGVTDGFRYYLNANAAASARLLYSPGSVDRVYAYDGVSAPFVEAGFTAGAAKRYCVRWSASRNKLRVENVTAGTNAESVFSTFGAFAASLDIGHSGGSSQANAALSEIKLCKTFDGCR